MNPYVIAAFAIVAAPTLLPAQDSAKHPAYLHALESLRYARGQVASRGGDTLMKWDEKLVVHEIDEAMREIKIAAFDDGKNLDQHPSVDVKLAYRGRLHRALELLAQANKDCHHEEANGTVRGLQKRAILHIEAAIRFTREGIALARR